jgi:hypothetical protein
MSTTSLGLSRQYASFSGVDIRVIVEGETIGSAQAVSYAVQREKAPIYVMGRVDPLSFSRGKRGIAGTMITLMLDQHELLQEPFRLMEFVADNDEIYPVNANIQTAAATGPLPAGTDTGLPDLEELGIVNFTSGDISANYTITNAWYVDQIPPFDMVVVACNEYGNAATMRIYGIEILNEGSGFSVDDIVIENQMTYVARTILPWQKLGSWNFASNAFEQPGIVP